MTCFACEREPTQQCSRCGRPYCDEHGDELCGICLHPSSGLPSFSLYRGSLLALLVATAVAVWLIVQPTAEGDAGLRPIVLTPTTQAAANRTPVNTTPGTNTTPQGGTPGASPTVRTTGTPVSGTPPAGATVTVNSGDSLSAICERIQRPAGMSVPDCVTQIVSLNNLANANDISVGQTLRVPR